jgi:hypothetical protein
LSGLRTTALRSNAHDREHVDRSWIFVRRSSVARSRYGVARVHAALDRIAHDRLRDPFPTPGMDGDIDAARVKRPATSTAGSET